MAKKLISILLIFTMILAPMTAFAEAADTDAEIAELVREQYEAFAQSKRATAVDERAMWDMANHALYGRGQDAAFGADSALSAVILNSELYKATVLQALTAAVTQMEWFGSNEMVLYGNAGWYDFRLKHTLAGYDADEIWRGDMVEEPEYTGEINDCDMALILLVGNATSRIRLRRVEANDVETVYNVDFYVADGFNFDNTYEDMEDLGYDVTLAETLTRIGKLLAIGLIKEYKWYAEADFQLTIPNRCSHTGNVYEWEFRSGVPESVRGGIRTENNAEMIVVEEDKEKNRQASVFYQLEETVHLVHDLPWVVEFEAESSTALTLSSTSDTTAGYPYLMKSAATGMRQSGRHFYRQAVMGGNYRPVNLTESDRAMLGVRSKAMSLDFHYAAEFDDTEKNSSHLFRLENRVEEDGSNMVHLYVDGTYAGPLEEEYLYRPGKTLRNARRISDGISGLDFSINYLGDRNHALEGGIYSLKIWENGTDPEGSMIDDGSLVESTCTTAGYFGYTCRRCFKRDISYYADPVEHRFGQDLQMSWNLLGTSYTSQTICADCGEIGTNRDIRCVVETDEEMLVELRVRTDGKLRSTVKAQSKEGVLNLTVPDNDSRLQMLAAFYDEDGKMTEVQMLSAGDRILLPLQEQSVKVFFLNRGNQTPLLPVMPIYAEVVEPEIEEPVLPDDLPW